MKVYEILALSRSGHHSVINWIIRNTIGFQCDWRYKLNQLGSTGLFFLNEANHDIPYSFQYVIEKKEYIKQLYLNYEDTPGDYTIYNKHTIYRGPLSLSHEEIDHVEFKGRVIIIRDFYNLLSSRIKLNENKISNNWEETKFLLNVEKEFISRWKSQAKSCLYNNTPYLKFEDWLSNKNIREKFLFDNFGLVDHFGVEGVIGTKSSFGSHEGVVDRHKQVEIPDNVKDLIAKDNELHYLMGRLGYEYKTFGN